MKKHEPDIRAISDSHIRRVDKLYRMCAGLASTLLSYESRVIELKIRKSKRWPKPPEETARQLAEAWKHHNWELNNAVGYLVHIYDRRTDPGFFVPARSVQDREEAAALADKIRESAEEPPGDVLVATVQGRFDDPPPPKWRRSPE